MLRLTTLLALLLAASPLVATGGLRIESQPGVEVVWEGVSLGTTDAGGVLTIADAPPGLFAITLRKPGFQDATAEVEIGPGEKTLRLELVASVASPSPPPAAAAERPVIEARTGSARGADPHPLLPVEASPPPESDRPRPATILPASGPPAGEPRAATAGSRSLPPGAAPSASLPGTAANVLYFLALALLLGALSLLLLRRSRARVLLPPDGLPDVPRSFDLPADGRAAGSERERRTAPFLEALKRREQALDECSRATPEPCDDDVIDVEVTAVRTAGPS